MKLITILQTFVSRFLVLVLNFGLVIYTTNVWGSEGKGLITIVLLNLAIVGFCSNIFVGGSVSYFARKFRTEIIILYAYLWSIIVGNIVPAIIHVLYTEVFTIYLIGLSISSSLLATNINLFIGEQKIKLFNLYSVLQLGLHIIVMFGIIFWEEKTDISIYFKAQIVGNTILFLSSFIQIYSKLNFKNLKFTKDIQKKIWNYGWKIQLSAFMQFLNYRFSYFILEFFKGLSSVGIFSVGIAISEAVWAISKSLSIVLYSDVINSNINHADTSILKTKMYIKVSFLVTLFFLAILFIIPAKWYDIIFGNGFQQSKDITLWLSPGILAIAVSNIIGHYFSGINKLKILNIKSVVGLFFTVILSLILIPRLGTIGACIATSISYIISSLILFWKFYQITDFKIQDYFPSKSDLQLVQAKFRKKLFF